MSSEKLFPGFPSSETVKSNNKVKESYADPILGETFLTPDASENNQVDSITAGVAGIASGIIKIGEGFVSLGAELLDYGLGTNSAVEVEQFFDQINPFEEVAGEKASGKILQALVQIGTPAGIGAKLATKLASKALQAKKAGRYVNLNSKNLQKGLKKTSELNNLSGKQKFAAVVLGGAAGETMVADVEDIGTFGDVFEAGPTELDRNALADPSEDAGRKLLNRLKFGGESIFTTPIVYGAFKAAGLLANQGKQLAYSNKKIEKQLDTVASWFRPRGAKPQEVFDAKRIEMGRLMSDTNFAMEKVKRIDREVNKMFPSVKSFLNKTTEDKRGNFLKELNDLLFAGDLKKDIPEEYLNRFMKSAKKQGANNESINTMVDSIVNVRKKFDELFDITAQGPVGIQEIKDVQNNLRKLMGDRVKQYLGTTYKIFENNQYSFFDRYKPSSAAVTKTKEIFKRYAAKNKNPITDEQAEELVNNVLSQARRYNPKTKLPTFDYDNFTIGATDPSNTKTFARTLAKELPDGTKEFQVIGRGSKAFRELFGEVEDARHSIFQGINDLGVIARKNQLFDEILDTDEAMKAAVKKDTPFGQRGFFFDDPITARKNLPNNKIVLMDDYVKELFKDGVLINRLSGTYTTKDIAEAFSNSAKVSEFMRGESGGTLGRTASWAWRNLFLTPKAGSQYAKTVLSIPTHFRNFLSSAAFSLANGTIFVNPKIYAQAMNKARRIVQVGLRDPKAMEEYRELLELGVTNSNTRMGDLKNLMRDAKIGESGNVATDSIVKPMIQSLGKIGGALAKGAKKTGQFMQDAYIAEDDFWKVINYEVELARRGDAYAKAGIKKTPRQLKEEAAEIVRNTVPNYAYVGEFVRGMRVTPFGNFMSWPSEIYRTGYGIMERALKDIKDPITGKINPITSTNPMKGIGMKRLIGGVTAFGALPYGIIKGTQSINGVTDEEAEAGKDFVAPWSKNSQIIWMKDPETGELSYSDWSSNNVYDTLTRPFQIVLNNIQKGIEDEEVLLKGFTQGLTEAAAEIASPFVSESIFTEAVGDIVARGGVTKDGKILYTEQTPGNEKFTRILKHIAETQAPQYKPYLRIRDSITGKPDNNGDVLELNDQIAGLFGFRMIKLRPDKGLQYYIADFQDAERNSRKEFTGGPEGVLKPAKSPEEVIERFYVANQALFKANKNMKRIVQNAKTLGLSEDKVFNTFKERGLRKDYGRLVDGQFEPFFPSKPIIRRFEDIAIESRTDNPFIQAEPILNEMYNVFYNLNLNEDWNFNLEEFLPQATPGGEQQGSVVPPLPEQPMPNPQIITPPMPQMSQLNQGLTPAESALLSEEDKQLRLRQRGLG
jgi:hypothetical protein